MKCKHYKGSGYTYKLKDEDLDLCEQCNMLLAEKLLGQLALEVFLPKK